ncbi:MAG: ATP-dependent zinc metalloprotease FtsH [Planctomycetes bacterium]|nr:ATP-dependent zinc metalloprotease FtsH [Planctomycetota bacterium]
MPIVLIFGLLWFVFLRKAGGGAGGPGAVFNFAKSKARLYKKGQVKVTFKDVAGIDEAVEETRELVQFLKTPEKFVNIGGQIPRGVLMTGPPGCGKTLLGKAIAGEADVPFFNISGSDFVEMFVGVGASRVRDLFKQAREKAPCVVFLDEIDAVGRQRGSGLGGGHDEREQTLNQILVEMDGFESNSGVIVIAATNRPDVLDSALLRPGRFDRKVIIDLPDVKGREKIFEVHMKKVKHIADLDYERIARATPGFTGADIANMVNEAAIYAVMHAKLQVDMESLEESRDKVRFGKERKSKVISERERKLTSYHEAGHALLQHYLKNTDPVHKITIIPRGSYGGATMSLPLEDRQTYAEKFLQDTLVVLFGGRIAEKIVFDEVSTGASNDIKQASEIARQMITNWGMNENIGPINVSTSEEHIFLGREIARQKTFSEDMARKIDEEMMKLIKASETKAKQMIEDKRDQLDLIANALMRFETISGEELAVLLKESKLEAIGELRRKVKEAAEKLRKEKEAQLLLQKQKQEETDDENEEAVEIDDDVTEKTSADTTAQTDENSETADDSPNKTDADAEIAAKSHNNENVSSESMENTESAKNDGGLALPRPKILDDNPDNK